MNGEHSRNGEEISRRKWKNREETRRDDVKEECGC